MANLRGLRESGALFAPPTYLYILMLVLLIGTGFYRVFVQHVGPIPLQDLSEEAQFYASETKSLSIMMFLRAFSSGAVALSGVEAVSNGVPDFKQAGGASTPPRRWRYMGVILGTCFLGVSILASHLQPYRGENDPTGIALMAEYIYGGRNALFWITQIATFPCWCSPPTPPTPGSPRLGSIIAQDGYLPRQMANRGDKLVFSNGIIFLAVVAGLLIVVFKGNITALIPLYAFGVFTGFTLSQAGMVVHHFRHKDGRWRGSALINGVGCLATGLVALIVVVSKFTAGAWIPAVFIPVLVVFFRSIGRHYRKVRDAVQAEPGYKPQRHTHTVVVLVGSVHRGVLDAIQLRPRAGAGPADRGVGGDRTPRSRSSSRWPGSASACRSPCTPSCRRTAS